MSNGDELTYRKSHIKRIYKDNDPSNDTWIDVERLDELRFRSKVGYQSREKTWKFDWDSFDPDGVDHDGNAIPYKAIQDPNDPDNVVNVPARRMVYVTEARDLKYQGYKHYFINDRSNSTRETYSRRVYHYDISADSLDENGDPPRDPSEYLNALGDKDNGQYVEVEVLNRYWTNEHESRDSHGNIKPSTWQEKKWVLDVSTDALLTDPGGDTSFDGSVINPDAGPQVDPPWRLDPLQNIVNVSWLGGLAVEFGEAATDAP